MKTRPWPRFVIRTIKNGAVRIYGRDFYPADKWLKYDGRLDDQRFAFGLYWACGENQTWELQGFAYLWGTENAYRDRAIAIHGPDLIDGSYPWAWWNVKDTRTDALV